jgi:hypothetical protein
MAFSGFPSNPIVRLRPHRHSATGRPIANPERVAIRVKGVGSRYPQCHTLPSTWLTQHQCDETRPECRQCVNGHRVCHYQACSTRPAASLIEDFISKLEIDVRRASGEIPRAALSLYDRSDVEPLVEHFLDDKTPWLGSPAFQERFQRDGLALAIDMPALIHGILAVSASHLEFLYPQEQRYGIAAAQYYHRSLALYPRQLQDLETPKAPAFFACSVLHSIMAFRGIGREHPKESSSDLFELAPSIVALRSIEGVHVVHSVPIVRERLINSDWSVPLNECNYVPMSEGEPRPHHEAIMALRNYCQPKDGDSSGDNPYRAPLWRLEQIIQRVPDHYKVGTFMKFVRSVTSDFEQLLLHNDPKALLILAYWYAILSNIDQWWIANPARCECLKICCYLHTQDNQDIRPLLVWPRQNCATATSQPDSRSAHTNFTQGIA